VAPGEAELAWSGACRDRHEHATERGHHPLDVTQRHLRVEREAQHALGVRVRDGEPAATNLSVGPEPVEVVERREVDRRRHAGLAQSLLHTIAVGALGQGHHEEVIRAVDCEVLGGFGITAAQVLLTIDDSESRRRYLNASNTLLSLLGYGVVPVVNENDTVATQELRYGDNDRLAARVAQMVSAECLVLLSDIDGLYTANPRVDDTARHIEEVTELKREHWDMAGGPGSSHGSGGMRTKLDAARIAVGAGCRMAIASGRTTRPIAALRAGGKATWFLPSATPGAARKQWIAGTLSPKGAVRVDTGAERALASGRSLLPAGVVGVDGQFERGDAVRVLGADGRELARGLIAYAADEARLIAGKQTAGIADVLGYRGRDEIIHRDDLVLIDTR